MTGVRIATFQLCESPRYRIHFNMKLILVRHGETKENINHITQGHSNSQLNEAGKVQAQKVAKRLENEKINAAYSSDLDRCVSTAKEILKYHPSLMLHTTPILREQGKGIFEGKPGSILHKVISKSDQQWYDYLPDGGETMRQVQERTKKFFEQLIITHNDETVLVVTHGGPMVCLFLLLFDKSFKEYKGYQPDNTAVTILDIKSLENHQFLVLNDVKHLKQMNGPAATFTLTLQHKPAALLFERGTSA